MPPFGSLYDLPLYIDASFVEVPEVAFPAASHDESIVMDYHDYARLARPVVADVVVVPHPVA
jgi:Ala-tRNA(Pro) deacylase